MDDEIWKRGKRRNRVWENERGKRKVEEEMEDEKEKRMIRLWAVD